MPVLQLIRKRFIKGNSRQGVRVRRVCTVTSETAISPSRCATAEPICSLRVESAFTQDEVRASLVKDF